MEAKEILEYYIRKAHSSKAELLTELDRQYLLRYSIRRESEKPSEILNDLDWRGTVTHYEETHPHTKLIAGEIQKIRRRFKAVQNRCKKFEEPHNKPFEGSFVRFLEWWCSEMDDNSLLRCCYCGVDEKTVQKIFSEKKIVSKKFTETLQIERMDPDGTYCAENCHFACPVCNNAKSDMISKEDFIAYFGPGIRKYWKHLSDI